jgi:hypothetical protein
MSLNVNGSNLAPARYTPPPPTATAELTARDMAAASRLGMQAVPVRNNDPVTGPAKREKRGQTEDEKKAAEDADRFDMLRMMAFRRDVAAVLDERDR